MEFHLPHFGHKADSPKDEPAADQPVDENQSPVTDEGITQAEVDKSEAFASPLQSEAVQAQSAEPAVINAEPAVVAPEAPVAPVTEEATETPVAEEAPIAPEAPVAEEAPVDNVVQLPTPEVVEPAAETAPVEQQDDTDHQMPAQTA